MHLSVRTAYACRIEIRPPSGWRRPPIRSRQFDDGSAPSMRMRPLQSDVDIPDETRTRSALYGPPAPKRSDDFDDDLLQLQTYPVAVLGWGQGAQAPQIFDWFRSALFLLEGFWGPEICLECVGGRGFAPDPAEGAHDAPPDPLVGWGGGHPSPVCPLPSRLGDTPSQEPHAFSVQHSLLGATFLAYTHLNFWQYTTNWFYSNFA